MTKILAVLLVVASSQSVYAMGKKSSAPPAPAPSPSPQINQVYIEKEYYHPETLVLRDQCLTQVHAELFRQIQPQLKIRGIDVVSQEGPTLTQVVGTVRDDSQGFEYFEYSTRFHVRKGSSVATLSADYSIIAKISTDHEEVQSPAQVDPLGNVIVPAKVTADRYLKTASVILTNNQGLDEVGKVDLVNEASGLALFNVADQLMDQSETYEQAEERALKMKCDAAFPVVVVPRP